MMMNLFSTFDPNSILLSLNWNSALLNTLFIYSLFWMNPSRYNFIWNLLMMKLYLEFKILNLNFKNSIMLFISLLLTILLNNLLGLFPYIFTSTSHLVMTLSLSMPLWLSFSLFGWMMNMHNMFIHLIPQGTPIFLMNFMICIESISNIIRPFTLAIRLMANMIAGHLLMNLLGNLGPLMKNLMIFILILIQILLLMLEYAVAMIQSYVFSMLSFLYSKETN